MSDIPPEQPPPRRQPPPPPVTAPEQAQQERSAAEAAAVALFVTAALAQGGDSRDLDLIRAIAWRLVKAIARMTLTSAGERPQEQELEQLARTVVEDTDVVPRLRATVQVLRRHVADVKAIPQQQPSTVGSLSPEKQAASAFATTAYSTLAVELSRYLPIPEGFRNRTLKKTWVSRLDGRVRDLHRRLHGNTVTFDKDFWRWPATGQRLRHPGDPEAPLDAIIGCRCILWLSWSKPDEVLSVIKKLPPLPPRR